MKGPVSLAIAAVLALSGCAAGRPPTAPAADAGRLSGWTACPAALAEHSGNPVIAATATSAEPRPALPRAVVQELTARAQEDDACVTVVAPDGSATAISLTPMRATDQVERGPRRAARARENVAAVQDVVARLAAEAPDLDTRGLIVRATRAHPRPATLYVISSGVSTAHPTDLRQLGWDTDGPTVGAQLREREWLPDLSGWTVRFVGIGDVAGAQPHLADPVRERLVAFWLGICRAAGARHCEADREYVGLAAPTSVNRMPVVDPPTVRLEAQTAWLPASALFTVGRADIGTDADRVLSGVADRLRTGGHTVAVIGHTDATTGTAALNLRLSRERAYAVRDRLVALGVPAGRIVAVHGVGSRDADPAAERDDPRLIDLHRNVEIRFGG